MYDLVQFIYTVLFEFTGGYPLIKTVWIYPWVLFWTVAMMVPVTWATCSWPGPFYLDPRPMLGAFLIATILISFFMIVITPFQYTRLINCELVEQDELGGNIAPVVPRFYAKKCRIKDNINEEYSDWIVFPSN